MDDMLGFNDMMAKSDEDDLFGGSEPVAAAEPTMMGFAQEESALMQWENAKKQQIAEIDSADAEKDAALREEGRAASDNFYNKLQEAQEKRAQHNKEVDAQKIMSQESTSENQWEKVVEYIDFNRTDLHEKDVSRMKSLLLQLKH